MIVTERGIVLLSLPGSSEWVPYRLILGYARLSKEPISKSVVLDIEGGRKVEIPFHPDGEAFGFVRFIMFAHQEALREMEGIPR